MYISCVYHDTRMQVIKALPLDVKQCTIFAGGVLRCSQFKS
ncbi:MAG: STY0301 family protein [Aeromonas sp.]